MLSIITPIREIHILLMAKHYTQDEPEANLSELLVNFHYIPKVEKITFPNVSNKRCNFLNESVSQTFYFCLLPYSILRSSL